MSLPHLGETRSRRALDHLLQVPEAFVYAPLPGMQKASAAVHVAPSIGAGFTQYTAVLEPEGRLGEAAGSRFIYVLEGSVQVSCRAGDTTLSTGSYAYIPQAEPHVVSAMTAAKIAVVEKPYIFVENAGAPRFLVGAEKDVVAVPLVGDEAVLVRGLLPDSVEYDFAVNTMEYRPGARLSMVEVHVMEHGLLMLEGEGIYRLGDAWYPVHKGDFIWMAPFCPQWFCALGERPTKYLIYKDWNRHPLVQAGQRLG